MGRNLESFTKQPGGTSPQFSYLIPADLALKNVPPVSIDPIKISTDITQLIQLIE